MFTHGTGCNAHCHDNIHAFLLLTEVMPTLSAFIHYAYTCGVTLVSVVPLTNSHAEPVVLLLRPGMQAFRVFVRDDLAP